MTPIDGDGSVEGNGSPHPPGYLNGKAAAPPPEPVEAKRTARREANISSAVLKALHQRGTNGEVAPGVPDAVQPTVNGDPDHPVHKRTRGAGLLPPDVRKRLQADILPRCRP